MERIMKLFATLFFTVIFSASNAWCHDNSDDDDYDGGRPKRTEAIKRPRHDPKAIKILRAWLKEHIDNPYPTPEKKNDFAQSTGLSLKQIDNWFTNARRRGLPLQEEDLDNYAPEESSKRRKVQSGFDKKNRPEDAQTPNAKTFIENATTTPPRPSLKEPKSNMRNMRSLYSIYDDSASDRLILGNSEMQLVDYNDDIGTWESYFNNIELDHNCLEFN
jgi:hypothetical protein